MTAGQHGREGGHEGHLLNRCRRLAECGDAGVIRVAPAAPKAGRQRWMMDEKLATSLQLPMATVKTGEVREGAVGSLVAVFSTLQDEKGHRYYGLGWYAPAASEHTLDLSTAHAVDATAVEAALRSSRAAPASPGPSGAAVCVGMPEFLPSMLQRGTYGGCEPMGPFFSMRPVPGSRFGLRYAHVNVERAVVVRLAAFHVRRCQLQDGSEGVRLDRFAATTVERWYFDAARCSRQEIEADNGVRGTLFVPHEARMRPAVGVIDMFGTAGGVLEFRASLYASHGFVALALPYFGYKDLPTSMGDLNLDYFDTAVQWMCSLPEVNDNIGIGLSGVSLGGELVLRIATVCPKVKAVAAISPSNLNTCMGFTYKGKVIPAVNLDFHLTEMEDAPEQVYYAPRKDGEPHRIYDFRPTWTRHKSTPVHDDVAKSLTPVEKMQCSLLLVAGMDDEDWPGGQFSNSVYQRLMHHGYKYPVVHRSYPGTGHLIEPPYAPFCSYSYHKLVQGSMRWGGVAELHNAAQEQSWKLIIDLFANALTAPAAKM
mmetsp:Transcript_26/g.86  ORF Transcript_26/g.86 Transcript_26/m.86 type:complete len:539 (+) Transcript_26:21-1637(+)